MTQHTSFNGKCDNSETLSKNPLKLVTLNGKYLLSTNSWINVSIQIIIFPFPARQCRKVVGVVVSVVVVVIVVVVVVQVAVAVVVLVIVILVAVAVAAAVSSNSRSSSDRGSCCSLT